MKGIIFNLLEEVVAQAHGDQAWDDLLEKARLDGVYTSLGSYDDRQFAGLVAAASEALSLPPPDVLRWVGRQAMPIMFGRWPSFFAAHRSTLPFLRSLNGVIHPEVRKLYAGAHCPHFDISSRPDGSMLIGYDSPRRLCRLAHGFIEGAGDHYGEIAHMEHVACMHDGDERCLLAVSVRKGAPA